MLDKVGKANLNANIVSTLQAGCFVGAIGAIWFCDKLGRRMALLCAAIVTIIGCVMQAASEGHIAVMYIGRYVLLLFLLVRKAWLSMNRPEAKHC